MDDRHNVGAISGLHWAVGGAVRAMQEVKELVDGGEPTPWAEHALLGRLVFVRSSIEGLTQVFFRSREPEKCRRIPGVVVCLRERKVPAVF